MIVTAVYLFSDELSIAKKFVHENDILTDYKILDLEMQIDNSKTYLFYKPYNNRVISIKENTVALTDAFVVKANNEKVLQFLEIKRNGLVKTGANIKFYDFSGEEYSHLRFNGWLLTKQCQPINNISNCTFELQLTNDGYDVIPADPGLPVIIWDYIYPVKYEFTMYPLPKPVWLFGYEWLEDIKISIARTGLRDNDLCYYLNKLIEYEKRTIINTMFAIHGYQFKIEEWKNFFSGFLWYKPMAGILNDVSILDEYQKKLFEYLTK